MLRCLTQPLWISYIKKKKKRKTSFVFKLVQMWGWQFCDSESYKHSQSQAFLFALDRESRCSDQLPGVGHARNYRHKDVQHSHEQSLLLISHRMRCSTHFLRHHSSAEVQKHQPFLMFPLSSPPPQYTHTVPWEPEGEASRKNPAFRSRVLLLP
jgi:hypothetical protein